MVQKANLTEITWNIGSTGFNSFYCVFHAESFSKSTCKEIRLLALLFKIFIISIPEESLLTHWNGYDDLSAIWNGLSENLNLFPFTFGIGKALSIHTDEFPM